MASQVHAHLHNNLFEQFQSGFRPRHSTETPLLKITNDLMAADSRQLSVFIVLDLSAVFNTISHTTLCDRLASFGISDTTLDWFKSYLSGHTQFIQLKTFISKPSTLSSGVPQGSVLCPILFISYLLPLGQIFLRFNSTSTPIVTRTTPSSTFLPNPPPLSRPPPSVNAYKKSKPGCLLIF